MAKRNSRFSFIFPKQPNEQLLTDLEDSLNVAWERYEWEREVLNSTELIDARSTTGIHKDDPSYLQAVVERLNRKRVLSEFAIGQVCESLSALGHGFASDINEEGNAKINRENTIDAEVAKIVKDCYGETSNSLTKTMVDLYGLAVKREIMDTKAVEKYVQYCGELTHQHGKQKPTDWAFTSEVDFCNRYNTLLRETFDDNGKNIEDILDALAVCATFAAQKSGVSSGEGHMYVN